MSRKNRIASKKLDFPTALGPIIKVLSLNGTETEEKLRQFFSSTFVMYMIFQKWLIVKIFVYAISTSYRVFLAVVDRDVVVFFAVVFLAVVDLEGVFLAVVDRDVVVFFAAVVLEREVVARLAVVVRLVVLLRFDGQSLAISL